MQERFTPAIDQYMYIRKYVHPYPLYVIIESGFMVASALELGDASVLVSRCHLNAFARGHMHDKLSYVLTELRLTLFSM